MNPVVLILAALSMTPDHQYCEKVSDAKQGIEDHGGRWVEATPEQRLFLDGVYAMNPETPAGLPVGNRVFIGYAPPEVGKAIIFYVDGDLACWPSPIPKEMFPLLDAIKKGDVPHVGGVL